MAAAMTRTLAVVARRRALAQAAGSGWPHDSRLGEDVKRESPRRARDSAGQGRSRRTTQGLEASPKSS